MQRRRKQRGATLLESVAFLGIASIVIVGAIAMFRAAQGSFQANDLLTQINGMRSTIRTLYASNSVCGTGNCNASITGYLVQANGVPDTLRRTSNPIFPIENQWGGRVAIYMEKNSGGWAGVGITGQVFIIEYRNVPQEVCIKAASAIGPAWVGAQLNTFPLVTTDAEAFPPDTASAQCTAGNSNLMRFVLS